MNVLISLLVSTSYFHYPAAHDYCCSQSALLVNQINVLGNEICFCTSRFANICVQIKQIGVIFSHLKLWVAVVRQNLFKYIKIMFQVISKVKLPDNGLKIKML